MEMEVVANCDNENLREETDQRMLDLALQAVYKETGKGKWEFAEGQWQQSEQRTRNVSLEKTEHVGFVVTQDTLQRGVEKSATKNVRH